jgi:putative redox protein
MNREPGIPPATATARDVLAGVAGVAELHQIVALGSWSSGMRSDIRAGRHVFVADEPPERGGQEDGPTPLQLVLSGLCGCEAVTMARMAKKMRIAVDSFEIEAAGVIDVRGRKGTADVPAHFLKVTVHARVRTAASAERVKALRGVVERHCPVATLLQSAPLVFESGWERLA